MPVINRLADMIEDLTEWRRHIHMHPGLMYDVDETADFVAGKLQAFGVDQVIRGLGRTGVVGIINGTQPTSGASGPRSIALRADMDALPIVEASGKAYTSRYEGRMHACGHDGHTAMLLGAAQYLAGNRNFAGRVVLIFQPAEEGGAGAKAMLDDGLLAKADFDEVYGLHNMPGLPVGHFAMAPGPAMAATDTFDVTLSGIGGHAAKPHQCADPIVAGAGLIQALQTVASRNTDPLDSVVVSVTAFQAGDAYNVIPAAAQLRGTIRTLLPDTRMRAKERFHGIVANSATAYGLTAEINFMDGYPVVVNSVAETGHAEQAARAVASEAQVRTDQPPMMGGEDFAYYLEARPGAFIWTGNGDSAGLHHPAFDFNDEALAHGASYWINLVAQRLGRA